MFRIEEYVSMALQYQRVSNTENDFVLEKVSLDGVIRDTIKKYAKTMIRRHIGINYSGTKNRYIQMKNGLHLYWSRYFQMP